MKLQFFCSSAAFASVFKWQVSGLDFNRTSQRSDSSKVYKTNIHSIHIQRIIHLKEMKWYLTQSPQQGYQNERLWLTHFWPMFLFYTPLKTSENQKLSGVFRGYKMGTLARNALKRRKKIHLWHLRITRQFCENKTEIRAFLLLNLIKLRIIAKIMVTRKSSNIGFCGKVVYVFQITNFNSAIEWGLWD